MSQRIETEAPIWPKEYDPNSEIIVESNSLYMKILRPKRINKPGRRLTFRTPQLPEITDKFGELRFSYLEEVEPWKAALQDLPGNHFHHRKVELFCPISKTPLFICLQHIETGERAVVVLVNNKWETYTQFLVLPKVAHTIVNPSATIVQYDILANMSEDEAQKTDVNSYPLDITAFSLPINLNFRMAKIK